MAKDYEETREFSISADELLVFVGLTFQAMGAPIYDNKPGVGLLSATKKSVRNEVEIVPLSNEKSKMKITVYAINVFGWRVPIQSSKPIEKHVDEFWPTLDTIIHRAQIQYG